MNQLRSGANERGRVQCLLLGEQVQLPKHLMQVSEAQVRAVCPASLHPFLGTPGSSALVRKKPRSVLVPS